MVLNERIAKIEHLFDAMHYVNASNWQIGLVAKFRKDNPEVNEDLDFCFEVLAGMHKLGYTYEHFDTYKSVAIKNTPHDYANMTLREFYYSVLTITVNAHNMYFVTLRVPLVWQNFIHKLVNRIYKLGYTNKSNMLTDKHCMLAKTYPQHLESSGIYYVQEKLNGVRCIAYYEDGEWKFTSRSQKPKDYPFDMSGMDVNRIYDGEVMTRNKLTNRDFTTTSGIANSKYGDKSSLMYFVYDIIDPELTYQERLDELQSLSNLSKDVVILDVLPSSYGDYWVLYKTEDNSDLDKLLDEVIARNGEGLIIRQADAKYHQSRHSGDRNSALLKYKQVKTCDLRIVGYNEGKGKYEGMIGSFICESDDGEVRVSVAGISDDIRSTNPDLFIGLIIEVAYFDISKSKVNDYYSLQFPRFNGFRHDKDETSMF